MVRLIVVSLVKVRWLVLFSRLLLLYCQQRHLIQPMRFYFILTRSFLLRLALVQARLLLTLDYTD